MQETDRRVPIDAQKVDAPLSQFAVFLVVSIRPGAADLDGVREVLAGMDDLAKTVGFRDMGANLSCVVGIGSAAWDRFGRSDRPAELRPFITIKTAAHSAPATPRRPAVPHPRRPGRPLLRVRAPAARRPRRGRRRWSTR